MFIIDDPATAELPARYGVDDFPLILQDKILAEDGSPTGDPSRGTSGILGDRMLVNGTHAAFLNVRTERVRLRILNGSNARMYHLAFADRREFHVVGNDAGLLPTPVGGDRVSLTPGERMEIVVTFTAGGQALLRTLSGSDDIDEGDFDLLKFVAAPRLAASPRLPARLAATAPIAVPPKRRSPPVPAQRARRHQRQGNGHVTHRRGGSRRRHRESGAPHDRHPPHVEGPPPGSMRSEAKQPEKTRSEPPGRVLDRDGRL